MKKNSKIAKFISNGLTLTLSAIIMRTVGVSFSAYITKMVGAEGIGLYTLTMSVYGFAVTFATSGVNLASTRLIAESLGREEKRNARRSLFLCLLYSLIFGSVTTLALFFGSDFIGKTLLADIRTIPSLRLLSLSMIPISLSSALNGYFTAVRRVSKNAASQLFEQAIKILVTSYALRLLLPRGIVYSCMALVGGGAIAELLSFLFLFSEYLFDRYKHRVDFKCENSLEKRVNSPALVGSMLAISIPVALSAYVRSALVTVENILIPKTLSKAGQSRGEALSSYGRLHSMAIPIVLYPMAALSSFAGLLIPEFAEKTDLKDEKSLSLMAENALHYTLVFAFGCAGMLATFARPLGEMIYNSSEAGVYIGLLAPVVPIMYLDHITDAILKGIGKQVYSMIVNISDSVLSILLVLLILPKMGAVGYVLVIAIAEIFNFSLSLTGMTNAISVDFDLVCSLLLPILNAFISSFFARSVPVGDSVLSLVLRMVLFALIYIMTTIVCKKALPSRDEGLGRLHI
ncbi:MAG: oligosaccharide flippase family protein [Clostridia bacterium]|nr:oligosaccharide flippase family protein [Clostridia bacterium]